MAHGRNQGDEMDMEVEMDNMPTNRESYYEYNNYNASHQSNGHHHPQQQHTASSSPSPPPPQQQQTNHNLPPLTGSQTRRFAAGHAEMQRSAFHSTQNEGAEDVRNKLKLADNSDNNNNAMDDSSSTAVVQPQKRPRRFTKLDPNDNNKGR